ncbi:recombinase family protein [Lichenicola cladoniae]|uniref:Recombinase family protein n=1 Tax=Lichenicola cladoniae TaxID=1484109 RepID=A0A6M8HRG1_9PROT|nr:recombinase family protein [Lichenicola cladoniae]NPD68708.1 recombinase family protein [Acetobacteraceae bacterium]QKE90857.1 recombinase family protein [Lichenicola cladoniae]
MAQGRFVAYFRVSTAKQGQSGLGLAAQSAAVQAYLNGGDWKLLGQFTDVESGKAADNRPELAKAMELAKLTGSTLVIAKLDRLSRNAAFLMNLADAGVDFVAVDMPNANRLTVGIMALVAQQEREAISARTKAALAATKAKGTVLGGWRGGSKVESGLGCDAQSDAADRRAASLHSRLSEMQGRGLSLRAIAAELSGSEIQTARGGAWTAAAVQRVLARL